MYASPQLMDRVAATTGHRDRDEIELSLVQLLLQFLQADAVALFKLVNNGTGLGALHCIAATAVHGQVEIVRGAATTYLLRDHPAWQRCVETGEPQQLQRIPGGCETLFAVPDEGEEIAGVLQVHSRSSADARDLHLVGGVLRIVRNHMALIDYGERDTLTGLLNRKTFETQFQKLRRELPPAGQAGSKPCWIGLVDVDHFKAVNDGYGHVFGDEVLLLVSQIIQRSFRGHDRVYRFGGEEFVILLQECPEQATAAALERLRAAVERHRFPQIGTVTVSIGWTMIRPQDAPADAIGRADTALYHAKDCGRNQVFQHERLITDGRLPPHTSRLPAEIELF
jgi:diguanylate cyclase (GGDEF)-like protein